MEEQKFSVIKRFKSFRYAINGLKVLVKEEHNARIHIVALICVLAASFVFNITMVEWLAVVFAIGMVITAEAFNSSVEKIADFVSPDKHDKIKKVKDLSAAAVLVTSVTALTIGLIIFIPEILNLF